jgi:hypothetical protein
MAKRKQCLCSEGHTRCEEKTRHQAQVCKGCRVYCCGIRFATKRSHPGLFKAPFFGRWEGKWEGKS